MKNEILRMHIQEQFPSLHNSIYVNTPTSCLLAKDVLDWRREHDTAFFEQGFAFRESFEPFLKSVKQSLADFFHADVDNTYLIPNFSFGFNTFLEGLSSSERFLLLQEDYPSVNYAIESRGFPRDYVAVTEHLEENILAKIKQFQPTVFAFSLVQYISGIKIDFAFIKRLKQLHPEILLIADGTQYCGTASFNFQSSGLDLLAASGYKWMMAGYGNGFLFIKESIKKKLYPSAHAFSKPTEPFLKEKELLSLYFEPGHQDTLTFGTLQQALLLLERTGINTIETNIRILSAKAKTAFATRGLLADKVVKRDQHSSIFNLSIDEHTYNHLQEAGIICVRRGTGVRVGFHFFNTDDDLNQILEVLDRSKKV